MNEEHVDMAVTVLAKCAAFDPYFPNGGEAITLAWAEAFAEAGLPVEDLLAGVARMYRHAGEDGVRPLPSTVIRHAKAAFAEALAALPQDRRETMIEAEHALQEMDFTPPEAHRIARRIALGRNPGVTFTAEQREELSRRLEERRRHAELPSRLDRFKALTAKAFRTVEAL
ncbi:hypothetical protein [Rhodococcus sp. PD04]|uniref:hypothetical protein n=1 Tax=Rhodococcus sp. PD04 TaxID=3109594 RepID=UPI002DD7C3D5|nr:hypothetical protein [Rhodococcus sp. PD04]WSE22346.1 hypothetical protein U9J23_22275 [Rhodococcus sp. PD04]